MLSGRASKSVYSVHLVQSFGLWRGMCPGSPVDTISVFRVESVRHGREINYQPSKLLCYVHFEKTYTLKTHVTFFESVYCELLEKTYTLNTHVKIGIFCTSRTKFRSLAWNVSGVPGRHNFGLSRGKCPAWPRNQFWSFAYSSSFANGSAV